MPVLLNAITQGTVLVATKRSPLGGNRYQFYEYRSTTRAGNMRVRPLATTRTITLNHPLQTDTLVTPQLGVYDGDASVARLLDKANLDAHYRAYGVDGGRMQISMSTDNPTNHLYNADRQYVETWYSQ